MLMAMVLPLSTTPTPCLLNHTASLPLFKATTEATSILGMRTLYLTGRTIQDGEKQLTWLTISNAWQQIEPSPNLSACADGNKGLVYPLAY